MTVWGTISLSWLIGSYFYEDNYQTVAVTRVRYVQMLQPYYVEDQIGQYWYQQDDAISQELAWLFKRNLYEQNNF